MGHSFIIFLCQGVKEKMKTETRENHASQTMFPWHGSKHDTKIVGRPLAVVPLQTAQMYNCPWRRVAESWTSEFSDSLTMFKQEVGRDENKKERKKMMKPKSKHTCQTEREKREKRPAPRQTR